MGSFYATCSISKMTLSWQPTSIQLLIPRKRYSDDNKGLYVSNEGACGQYVPFMFPIHGKYYDYGRIEDVKQDHNTKAIEDFFNLSIEDVMDCCTDDRWYEYGEKRGSDDYWKKKTLDGGPIKNVELLKKMTLTYWRTEIWEHICEGWNDLRETPDPNAKYSWDNYFPNMYQGIIKHYDFEAQQDPISEEEIQEEIDSIKKRRDEYEEKLKTETDEKIIENLKLHIRLSDPSRDKVLETIKHLRRFEEWKKSGKKGFPDNVFKTYLPEYGGNNFFKMLTVHPNIFGEEIKRQYIFLSNLGHSMSYLLTPSIYGSQETNFKYLRGVYEKVNELLKEDEKYWGDEDEYDEAEEKRKLREAKISQILKVDLLKEEKEQLLERVKEIENELSTLKIEQE